jgi:hypothetical protein
MIKDNINFNKCPRNHDEILQQYKEHEKKEKGHEKNLNFNIKIKDEDKKYKENDGFFANIGGKLKNIF